MSYVTPCALRRASLCQAWGRLKENKVPAVPLGGHQFHRESLLISHTFQNYFPRLCAYKQTATSQCPFDSQVTYLHRLAARAKHGLHVDRSVLRKGGFESFWGDHNRGDYGHYKLLWSKLRAEPRPEENRLAHMKKPAASRNK